MRNNTTGDSLPPHEQAGWNAQMQLLHAANTASSHAKAMRAVNWEVLDATTILTHFRPLCWCAIGSGYALDQDGLQELKQRVIDMAVDWVGQGMIDPVEVLTEMAGMSWRDQIAAAALRKIGSDLTHTHHRAFCELLSNLANATESGLHKGSTQKELQAITEVHLLEADLTIDHMRAIVLEVGEEAGLDMLRRMMPIMNVREMNQLWNHMCFHTESPLTTDGPELACACVEMLTEHYGVDYFRNPWDE